MNKKTILIAVALLVLVAGVFWVMSGDEPAVDTERNTDTQNEAMENEAMEGEAMENEGEVKEYTIAGGNYYYTIDEIRVKKGDTVRITFSSEEGFHDLVLDEFDVATERYRPGEGEETIEFIAGEAGEFEYYCSVGDHREKGQVGTLIVEE